MSLSACDKCMETLSRVEKQPCHICYGSNKLRRELDAVKRENADLRSQYNENVKLLNEQLKLNAGLLGTIATSEHNVETDIEGESERGGDTQDDEMSDQHEGSEQSSVVFELVGGNQLHTLKTEVLPMMGQGLRITDRNGGVEQHLQRAKGQVLKSPDSAVKHILLFAGYDDIYLDDSFRSGRLNNLIKTLQDGLLDLAGTNNVKVSWVNIPTAAEVPDAMKFNVDMDNWLDEHTEIELLNLRSIYIDRANMQDNKFTPAGAAKAASKIQDGT